MRQNHTTLINQIKSSFLKIFNKEPILIFSPGRINIIGEHTDYNDGFVFPAAINKGIITAIQKSISEFCTVVAADFNETFEFSLNNIQSIPNGGWKNYLLGVIAEIQKKGIKLEAFNIVFGGDIPVGSGLSSSAALENSIVFGLNELFRLGLTKKEMILISQKAEHNYVGVRCGIMDQYASMFGKKNNALFLDCRSVEANEINIDLKEYQLVLINTNVKHSLSESAYNDRRSVCEKVATMLNISALRDATEEDLLNIKTKISEEDYQKALYVIQENKRVQKATETLKFNDISALGKLLYESHNGLQNQYKVSCPELDFLVDKAKENSNIAGARMMGGGFGGCTINIIAKSATELFIKEISDAYQEKFNKECSVYFVEISEGTHLIKQ
ncbi:galactokinase [Lutibacter sp.]|uniref:galactokinase n=1 Tax=Lutibacter sp. TaxID=1925666 RepID=UPI003567E7C4